MNNFEIYSPRSDNHLQQPEGQKPHRSGPAEPSNVAFARQSRIALLEELGYYRDMVAEGRYMDEFDVSRMAYLEGREAEVKAILGE